MSDSESYSVYGNEEQSFNIASCARRTRITASINRGYMFIKMVLDDNSLKYGEQICSLDVNYTDCSAEIGGH